MQNLETIQNNINCLNPQQRKIFDDVIERSLGKPFFLYIAGDPGTGKTFLINTIISALRIQYLKSGMGLDKDSVLIMCPTASASKHMSGGDTIHGALKFMLSDNGDRNLSHDNEGKLANHLSEVKVLIIDEISMVGSKMLLKINNRLKRILGNEMHFGGLSVITTGDFLQLPPVHDSFAFLTPKEAGRPNHAAPKIWHIFKMYMLTQKMRSKDDILFQELIARIGKNTLTQDNIKILEGRVDKCPTISDNQLYMDKKQIFIAKTHKAVDDFNLDQVMNLEGRLHTFPAKDMLVQKDKQLPDLSNFNETKLKGLPNSVSLKINAPVNKKYKQVM